jgi:hypothetical protein
MSYSLYVIHHPLLALLRYKNPDPSNFIIIMALILVFALAYLSYRYIETPFRDSIKISKSSVYKCVIFLSIIFILYGSIGHLTNGFAKLKINNFQKKLLSSAVISPKRNICHTSGPDYLKPEKACKYFSEKPTWAVFGDSHAVELSYALADKLKTSNDGVIQLSFSHCPPIYNSQQPASDNAECSNWTNESLDYILKNSEIKNIIISYRLNLYLFGNQKDVFPKFPSEVNQNNRETYWKSLIEMTNLLIASHKNVYLILQAPELNQSIDKLIINSKTDNNYIAGVSIEWWKKRNQFVTDNISLINKKVKIINPADKFCDSTNCYAVINGKSLYWDDNHMSVYGARIIVNTVN